MFYFHFIKVLNVLSKTCFVLSFCFVFVTSFSSSAADADEESSSATEVNDDDSSCGRALTAADSACKKLVKKGLGVQEVMAFAAVAMGTGDDTDDGLAKGAETISVLTGGSGAYQVHLTEKCNRKIKHCEKRCIKEMQTKAKTICNKKDECKNDTVTCPEECDKKTIASLKNKKQIRDYAGKVTLGTLEDLKPEFKENNENGIWNKYLQCGNNNIEQRNDGRVQYSMNLIASGLAAAAAKDVRDGMDDEKVVEREEDLSLAGLDQGNGNGFNSLNPEGSFAEQDTGENILPEEPYYAGADIEDGASEENAGAGNFNSANRGRNPSAVSGGGGSSLPSTNDGGKKAKTQASGSSIGYGVGSGLTGSGSSSGSFSGSGYQARVENSYLKRNSKKVAQLPKSKAGFSKRTAIGSKKGRSIFDKASKIIKNFCRKEATCK